MSGYTAKELRGLKCNLFATKDSLEESFSDAVEMMGGQANPIIIALYIHQNTLLEVLARREECGEA